MFPYSFNNLYGYLRFSNMYMSSPTIEEKLKKADCQLDELLDEDEIIQEVKNQNAKLLNFFDKKNVNMLLDYIIREPESDDQKKGHKYPFIASEILNCDVNKINELFTTTEAELMFKDRKRSSMSNADSDMVLSSDDHAFSCEEKMKKELKHTEHGRVSDMHIDDQDKTDQPEETVNTEFVEAEEGETAANEESRQIYNNRSISDLVVENLDEVTPHHGEQENNSNKIVLLDHLLSFVETDQELNYVLVGYFSKFLNLLLNKFPHKIIGYIYNERPEVLDRMIRHVDRKSISEILPKLLLIESYISPEKGDRQTSQSLEKSTTSNAFANMNNPLSLNLEAILEIRKRLLNKLFTELSVTEQDFEKTSNISSICIEVIENRNVLEIILAEKQILDHLTAQLAVNTEECKEDSRLDYNYNYNEILNVFINLIRFSQVENLKSPTYSCEGEDMVNSDQDFDHKPIENTLLGESVMSKLDNILKNFLPAANELEGNVKVNSTAPVEDDKENQPCNSNLIEGTFGFVFRPLGSKRVKLVELVHFLLSYFKNVQSVLDKILIKSEFLKYMIQYFFQYEWNNMYQLNFESLLKSYFTNINNHPEITRYLFEDLKLLNILIENGMPCTTHNSEEEQESGFSFNSNRKINHGYFAVLVEICHRIVIIENSNPNFKENYVTPEWDFFVKEKVIYWRKLFDRKLCVPEPQITTTEETSHISTGKSEEEASKEKSEDVSEEISSPNESPFQRDEYFFQMGNENDDWLNPKKNEDPLHPETNLLEDINSFEFVDDNRIYRKSSQEEILLKERDLHKWKVDEIDDGNYSDTSYWKGVASHVLSADKLSEILKDLEL